MLTTTLLLSLLIGAPTAMDAATGAPADASERGDVVQVDDDEEVEGVNEDDFEREYFAFSTNDNLHPSVEDDTMVFHIAGLLGCIGGQIWLPILILGEQPEDWVADALISWAIWSIPGWVLSVLGPLAWIGWIYSVIVHFYVIPVNVINAWDRAAKTNGMKEGRRKKRRKKKQRSDDETSRHGQPPEAPLAAMAY